MTPPLTLLSYFKSMYSGIVLMYTPEQLHVRYKQMTCCHVNECCDEECSMYGDRNVGFSLFK